MERKTTCPICKAKLPDWMMEHEPSDCVEEFLRHKEERYWVIMRIKAEIRNLEQALECLNKLVEKIE